MGRGEQVVWRAWRRKMRRWTHDNILKVAIAILAVATIVSCLGCTSIQTGGGYIQDGLAVEVTALSPKNIGARFSFGQEFLPPEWAHWGDRTDRFAASVLWQAPVYKGFYLEPRLDVAYYPDIGTEFELEAAGRVGWKHDWFGVYIGARHPLGNGDRHEDIGRYSHIPDGWKIEAGFQLTWRW